MHDNANNPDRRLWAEELPTDLFEKIVQKLVDNGFTKPIVLTFPEKRLAVTHIAMYNKFRKRNQQLAGYIPSFNEAINRVFLPHPAQAPDGRWQVTYTTKPADSDLEAQLENQ